MITIQKKHLAIIKRIVDAYDCRFFVFGSRTTGKASPLSDLDLLYFDDIPSSVIVRLKEEFEESDLPYTVDLLNYNACDEDFKKIIGNNYVPLSQCSGTQDS